MRATSPLCASCAVADDSFLKLALTALESAQIETPTSKGLDPDYPHGGTTLGAKRATYVLGGMWCVCRDGHDAPPPLQAGAQLVSQPPMPGSEPQPVMSNHITMRMRLAAS
jgi:hypothetical protein